MPIKYGDRKVAMLTVGRDTHIPNPEAETKRKALKKRHRPAKDYVLDDFDVPTRRYAYVEKSIFQFMDLARFGVLTGRSIDISERAVLRRSCRRQPGMLTFASSAALPLL